MQALKLEDLRFLASDLRGSGFLDPPAPLSARVEPPKFPGSCFASWGVIRQLLSSHAPSSTLDLNGSVAPLRGQRGSGERTSAASRRRRLSACSDLLAGCLLDPTPSGPGRPDHGQSSPQGGGTKLSDPAECLVCGGSSAPDCTQSSRRFDRHSEISPADDLGEAAGRARCGAARSFICPGRCPWLLGCLSVAAFEPNEHRRSHTLHSIRHLRHGI